MTNYAERILAVADSNIAETRALRQRLDEIERQSTGRRQRDQRYADAKAVISDERDRRWLRDQRRADAAEEQDRQDVAKRHADHCQDARLRMDEAFRAHGLEGAPRPEADEYPGDYRVRAIDQLLARMPSGYKYRDMGIDDLTELARQPAAYRTVESAILADAIEEGRRPTGSNRADSAYDRKAERVVEDPATGQRMIVNTAATSFIRELSRQGARVIRLADPGRGIVLMGRPWPPRAA
jgi:hypothetical protein